MDENQFWTIVDSSLAVPDNRDAQVVRLERALDALTADEVFAFQKTFNAVQARLHERRFVGAALLVNGFAADDDFEYFQRWLISRGRKVYEAAVADPDSLAAVLARSDFGNCDFEEFATVSAGVWSKKTGRDPFRDADVEFPYTGAPPLPELMGEKIDLSPAGLAIRYPRLWTLFGHGG